MNTKSSPLPCPASSGWGLKLLWLLLLFAGLPALLGAGVASAAGAPVIISPTSATATLNQTFNYQIILANFETGTYSASNLPPGLALDPNRGVISGDPTQTGLFAVGLTATNANGTGNATLNLTVVPAGPPEITSSSAAGGQQGTPFSFQVVASNDPTAYAASGLPAGLVIDPATGVISGTPSVFGTFNIALSASNSLGSGNAQLALAVIPSLPIVTVTADVPNADAATGTRGKFLLMRTGGDISQPLTVVFAIKGTAQNGIDYQMIPLMKTIDAGAQSKHVKVKPILVGNPPPGTKGVKLVLQSADTYVVGPEYKAKVKISYP